MSITQTENQIGQLLFECCNAPQSRLTRKALSAKFGAEAFAVCESNRWVIPGSCDPESSRCPFLITLVGRAALTDINNRAVNRPAPWDIRSRQV